MKPGANTSGFLNEFKNIKEVTNNLIKNTIILFIAILFINILNNNGYSEPNYSKDKVDTLLSNYNKLLSKVDSTNLEIRDIKSHYENVTLSIQTANTFVQYSAGILALLTIIIAFFSYVNINGARNVIKEADTKILESEKKFNEFINSPEKISDTLERMNKSNAERLLFSNDVKDFSEGLQKSYSLSREIRTDIAIRIRDKIFNPEIEKNHFIQLYNFLLMNLQEDFKKIIPILFNMIREDIFNDYGYSLLNEIFRNKPYLADPIKFIESSTRDKNFIINILIGMLENEELEKLLINMLEKEYDLDYGNIASRLKKDELTEKVEKYLPKISEKVLNQIKGYLLYSKKIATKIYNDNKDLSNIDPYISNSIKNDDDYNEFLSIVDFNNENNWVQMINNYLPNLGPKTQLDLLFQHYNIIKDKLPKNKFFNDILPLLFTENNGVKFNGLIATFNGKPLTVFKDKPFFGFVTDTVIHPILKKHIYK